MLLQSSKRVQVRRQPIFNWGSTVKFQRRPSQTELPKWSGTICLASIIAERSTADSVTASCVHGLNRILKASKESVSGGRFLKSCHTVLQGYWKMQVSENYKDVTTFKCKCGTFLFEVISFSLMNAPQLYKTFWLKFWKVLTSPGISLRYHYLLRIRRRTQQRSDSGIKENEISQASNRT